MSQKMTKEKSDAGFCIFRSLFSSHGRVARVVEKYGASPSGVSTLRDLPSRGARQVFPSVHPTELDGSAS
jgi:hypothetical protein